MKNVDQLFRRNLIAAAVVHGLAIIALLVYEGWSERARDAESLEVALFTPADLLGDMPKGAGYGRGAYAPAPPSGGGGGDGGEAEATLAPEPPSFTPEERTAPAPDPGEVYVPKKEPVQPKKTKPAATSTTKTTAKTTTSATKSTKPASTAKTTKPVAKGSGSGAGKGSGTGPNAKEIRNLFANALKAAEGGTPYGDGRAPGGGEGRSSVIGSPNGSPDGVVGGVGKGSPFWWYYQHVHDVMYEAWRPPGGTASYDKNLVAIVRLKVARDGTILDAKLVAGSGNRTLDDSAVTAARGVSQLKPLPDGLGGASTDITVNFRVEG